MLVPRIPLGEEDEDEDECHQVKYLLQGKCVQDWAHLIGEVHRYFYLCTLLLLHPAVGDVVLAHVLVDVLERVLQAAAVDLTVGEAELAGGVLVLGVLEVAEQDASSVVVGHLTLRFVTLRFDLRLQLFDHLRLLEDERGEFGEGHLGDFGRHVNFLIIGDLHCACLQPIDRLYRHKCVLYHTKCNDM